MITTSKISDSYYDIRDTLTGKGIGSVACGADGIFQWHPFLEARPVLAASLLHAVATFIDSLNKESTSAAHANPSTATD